MRDILQRAALCLAMIVVSACTAEPERFDIAYIEQNPTPSHLRYMSDAGNLSSPVYLPNGLWVHNSGHNSLSWSPDGNFIAFAAGPPGSLDIYTMRPGGGNFRQVTTNPARDESPAWSPDGTRIVFITTRNDPNLRDIYIHDLASGTEMRITPTSDFYLSPVWSPDGTKIAYAKSISFAAGDEIFIHDLATGTATQIGTIGGSLRIQGLHWAPATSTLLFYVPGGMQDVYRIGINGAGLANLTTDLSNEISTQPSWYSGNRVLFVRSTSFSQNGIYRMAVNGASKTLIGQTEGLPWGPVYRFTATDLPDLVVSDYSATFDATDPTNPKYRVAFKIRNIGLAPSTGARVNVDAIDPDPPSGTNEIRIQGSVGLAALSSGEQTAELSVSFPLAEMFAKDVSRVRISADAKNDVTEAFESNNTAELNWP